MSTQTESLAGGHTPAKQTNSSVGIELTGIEIVSESGAHRPAPQPLPPVVRLQHFRVRNGLWRVGSRFRALAASTAWRARSKRQRWRSRDP